MRQPTFGTVYGVGVGPGDPRLVTVLAAEVLGRVSVLVAPGSRGKEGGLALDVARSYLSPECRVIVSGLPMTADQAELRKAWEETARILAGETSDGRDVAFVTLGDPTLYSTWGYVMSALRSLFPEVPVKTIPGVMSMAACAAHAGIPLAQGREPLLVWPMAPGDDLRQWLEAFPNVVVMKAGSHLEGLAKLAESSGHGAVAVRRVGRPVTASTCDLRSWSDESDYFTTVILKSRPAFSDARVRPGGGAK
ncbi:MAG: precorrin-2 C(20)-methyltransferase [Thermoleophilia bacterium]|nr:precorrin-2 C(20)-methyltransferase [Thermoleophilia bacterium]